MLRRFRSIKPTHLWHLTSKKDFLYVLNRRLTARENLEHRERKDLIQLVAITIASSIGLLYSYGKICPEKMLTTIFPEPCNVNDPKEPASTDTKKYPNKGKTPPCPPENDTSKLKPCPKS